jgi:zinc protease
MSRRSTMPGLRALSRWPVAFAACLTACGGPQVQRDTTPPAPQPEAWIARPQVGPLAQAQLPEPKRLTVTAPGSTAGGVRLFVVERHDAPAVFLRWVLPGGRGWEFTGGKNRLPEGTLQLTAELLTMGTRTHPDNAFAIELARHGGQLEAAALADAVIVQGQVLSHEITPFLQLVREALTEPTLDKGALDGMRQRHAAALENEDADADAVASRLARRLVYGPEHVYGSPGLTLASLPKIQRKHILEAFKQAFSLGGTDLVIVGDVDAAQLAIQLQALFGPALAVTSTPPQAGPPNAAAAEACHVVDVPGAVQTAIIQANPGPARRASEWPVLQLANQVLGGSASSRLFSELREKRGLTYGVYSSFEGLRAAGQWLVSTDVATAKTGVALQALGEELTRARREPPTAEELGAARRYLTGQFALSLAAPDNVADLVTAVQLYDLPADVYARFLDGVQQATGPQVLEATEAWIGKAPTTTVLAGQLAALRPGADATCARLVQRDGQGRIVRVLVGTDAEMGDPGRKEAFAAWRLGPEGQMALARYVKDDKHAPAFRAQALAAATTGDGTAKVLELGRKATDWPAVAQALWPLLTDALRRPALDQPKPDDPQPKARAVLLAMTSTPSSQDKGPDLDPTAAASVRKAVADWALAGLADLPADRVRALAEHRLAEGDLLRLGEFDAPAVGAWIAADVRRHEAARALVQAGTTPALGALLNGYRRLYARGVQPDTEDLQILGAGERAETLLLLLDVHVVLERSDEPPAVRATAATMQTIRAAFARLAEHGTLQPGHTDLVTLFDKFEPHLEMLLAQRNADDRWWAATQLVRVRGVEGLRKVLAGMAVDDHYRDPKHHAEDTRHALATFAEDVVAPLGGPEVQPLLFAALAGNQAMAKVIAVKTLEALGDDASVAALKTYGDDTDVGVLLDLPGTLLLRDMAMAAVDVRRYFREIDDAVTAGQMNPSEAVVYKAVAFETVDLTDKRLRVEVQRLARERLPQPVPPPQTPTPTTTPPAS